MARYQGDDYDRDVLDMIPERYDADADSSQARAGYRLRSYLTLGVAVIAVGGIVAAGLHFMNNKRVGVSGIPVIRADDRPIKIRPTDPGGMQVPNQDKLVYGRMEGESESKVERLLPPPEQPQLPVKSNDPADSLPPKPSPTAEVLRPGTPPAAKPSAAAQPVVTPREPPPDPVLPPPKVVTPVPAASPVAAPAAPQIAAAKPAAAPPVAAKPAAPVVASPPAVAKPVPPPVAPPPPAVAAAKPVTGGDWLIQLGALRSAADADKEWGRIQHANHDLLGSLRSDVMRVDLPDKGTFFRLRAGPVSEQSARQLCTDLKTRSQGCMIVRK